MKSIPCIHGCDSSEARCLDNVEAAWGAGLFDGEGTIFARIHRSRRCPNGNARMHMALCMTQEDPVRHFHQVVSVGQVVSIPVPPGGRLPQWRWQTTAEADIRYALALLWPYLSEFKKCQARLALTKRDEYLRYKHRSDASGVQPEEGSATLTVALSFNVE